MLFSSKKTFQQSREEQGLELQSHDFIARTAPVFPISTAEKSERFFGVFNDRKDRIFYGNNEENHQAAHGSLKKGAFALNTPILKLENVSLSFGGVQAISQVNLEIERGKIRSIIGPNGAGKSSIINVISGIYAPQVGKIWIDGKGYSQVPAERLAHLGVARTFQNLALFPGLTVLENVALGLSSQLRAGVMEQLLGWGRAARETTIAKKHSLEILDFLALSGVKDRFINTLSYGFQKRVELARALVARPKILLLDEPMAGMTASEKQEMALLVRAARDQFGMTVILIEHDLGIVMGISDHITVFDQGRKIADGSPAEVRNNQAVIDAYIGVVHEEEKEEKHV